MKAKVYNQAGKEVKEVEISDAVFNVPVKSDVVHEVFTAIRNNAREPWADTKNRGEVRGGGKKPWQQKGTGRARHGSIRSPIWKGGGVAFGPLSIRNYKTKINKKTRRLATRMSLSDKAQSGALWILENFSLTAPKTKLFASIIKNLPGKQRTFLVVTAGKDAAVMRATNNIKSLKTARAEDLNVVDILSKQALITTVEGIKKIEEVLNK